ncbi:hypothetical protein [Nocardia testacea]|uniref:hypothetical protein n=1 Tax=Nocardia testacea TaxID=248551 RepID=UPI0033C78729
MIRRHQCLSLACDECEAEFGEDDGTIHFLDITTANKNAASAGWVLTGTQALCRECAARAACALVGHIWTDWTEVDLRCYRGRRRSCQACDLPAYDPPLISLDDLPPLDVVSEKTATKAVDVTAETPGAI